MIDINSDVGERTQLLEDDTYYQLMDYITSINIACGGHAGDYKLMKTMIRMGIETVSYTHLTLTTNREV